jgi:hypothetical protein
MGKEWMKKQRQKEAQKEQKGAKHDSQSKGNQAKEKESKEVGDVQVIDYSKPGAGVLEHDNN